MSPARWPAFFGAFVAAFDNFAMTPLVRAIANDFHVDLAEATQVASAYYLAYGVSVVVWSRVAAVLSPRLGVLRSMLFGGVMLTAGWAAVALAPAAAGVLTAARC